MQTFGTVRNIGDQLQKGCSVLVVGGLCHHVAIEFFDSSYHCLTSENSVFCQFQNVKLSLVS